MWLMAPGAVKWEAGSSQPASDPWVGWQWDTLPSWAGLIQIFSLASKPTCPLGKRGRSFGFSPSKTGAVCVLIRGRCSLKLRGTDETLSRV